MELLEGHNFTCYFHNLAFDGNFILNWLFRNGYEYTDNKRVPAGKFTTLISRLGKYYSIKVAWRSGTKTEFRDSLKKIPLRLKDVSEAFDLDESKGIIDYSADRPVGYRMTDEERDYLKKDVSIIAHAMRDVYNQGMTRLTIGADSLASFKEMKSSSFDRLFPVLSVEMDADVRDAYRGGWTIKDNRFGGKVVGRGAVYDVNSLYPYVMYDRLLPYGVPKFFDVKPDWNSRTHTLHTFTLTFTAKLKKNHVPCIQDKHGMFRSVDYLENIDEPLTMTMTDVDYRLFMDQYNMTVLAWQGGWSFKAIKGVFADYISYWMGVKVNSTGGRRQIAKLHLNSLYGKFATNPDVTGKYPTFEDMRVKLKTGEPTTRDPVYTPMGVFITAYARDITIRAAQSNYQTFAYADTDSLHLISDEPPRGIEVHPTKLGAWKREYEFERAFYIRPKAYLEQLADGTYKNAIAGLPKEITEALTFDDVYDGHVIDGKLIPKSVPGGVVLVDTPYRLKV